MKFIAFIWSNSQFYLRLLALEVIENLTIDVHILIKYKSKHKQRCIDIKKSKNNLMNLSIIF
jgi:hypothetical protein